ncbi:MAG: nitrile hydratase subunit alpha, partial [Alphaproteobacteria bacterium]
MQHKLSRRALTGAAFGLLGTPALVRDGKAAAEAAGASMAGAPELGVLENTPKQHHLVVCTLCSCYPR